MGGGRKGENLGLQLASWLQCRCHARGPQSMPKGYICPNGVGCGVNLQSAGLIKVSVEYISAQFLAVQNKVDVGFKEVVCPLHAA